MNLDEFIFLIYTFTNFLIYKLIYNYGKGNHIQYRGA